MPLPGYDGFGGNQSKSVYAKMQTVMHDTIVKIMHAIVEFENESSVLPKIAGQNMVYGRSNRGIW